MICLYFIRKNIKQHMNFKYLISCLLILICICCQEQNVVSEPWKIAQINQRSERISLLMETAPASFSLSLQGEVDGPYQIFLAGSQRQQNEIFNFTAGAIDTVIRKPWTDPVCKVIYVPNINKVKAGQLEVDLKLLSK